jgi:CheY-like chemotaxis protein
MVVGQGVWMKIAADDGVPGGVTEGDVRCLRRHARALTGSQAIGDALTLRSLEAAVADPARVRQAGSAKVALFAVLHDRWQSGDGRLAAPDTSMVARAEHHMARLTPRSRAALLLRSIEGFAIRDIAAIMRLEAGEVGVLIREAEEAMMESVAGRVMVIEDDPIIALDLQGIVAELGHDVTGVATTRAQAVALAGRVRPDLVLADVQLADWSSGIAAVQDILSRFAGLPVIFVTGHPDQLLTGRGSEPAFVITKPFTRDQVRSAVSQAMFFASTEAISGDADMRRVVQ